MRAALLVLAALLPPANPRTLPPALAGDAPTLLLPIFTRCGGTCPVSAVYLKEALSDEPARFRVVVLSFDPDDTDADLRDFRKRLGLPAQWVVTKLAPAETRAFLDGLDFHVMKTDGVFDHPNQTFVFSPRGVWAATFNGSRFPQDELDAALRRARAADDPSLLARARLWLLRPEAWLLLAAAGLALSLLTAARAARASATSRRSPAARATARR
jgi:hypothetical protein